MHLSSPLAGAKARQGRAACVYHKIGYPANKKRERNEKFRARASPHRRSCQRQRRGRNVPIVI
ncbi:hypothetical protein [Mesorhizobium sp. M0205]|uniref:hypothetical protein n=1 Tax=Mesorhizobium sp. M0205 TaxID=2956914 RepID=UPI003334EB7E